MTYKTWDRGKVLRVQVQVQVRPWYMFVLAHCSIGGIFEIR